MQPRHRHAAILIAIITVGTIVAGCVQQPEPLPAYEHGPPVDAPTIDYAALSGIDPQTEQTIRERERNNDLQWRVEKLEKEVRRLNQVVFQIKEIRIGEQPEETLESKDEE